MIATVGLFVGPYRNLTTLTAGVLSLHPSRQVMNHGFDRLLPHLGILLWPQDGAACGPSANAYPVEPADRALYERRVRRLFSDEPAGRELLLGLPL